VVVKWTLATVLKSWRVGSTSETWSGGPASISQIDELQNVRGALSCLPAVSQTYDGVPYAVGIQPPHPDYEIGVWTLTPSESAYPTQWQTNWNIQTYIHFEQSEERRDVPGARTCLDHYMTVNGATNWTDGFAINVTGSWYPNAQNDMRAWDAPGLITGDTNYAYCSPFHIVHFLMQVPGVLVRFQAHDINQGFDPTEVEPWVSVGVGSTNQNLQILIEGGDVELAIKAGDEGKVSVTPTNDFSDSEWTGLTIIGKSATPNAVIEVRKRGLTNAVAALHVMVLPWITNTVAIYRVEDQESEGTRPVGGPAAAEIIAGLNSIYTQACVQFSLLSNALVNIVYDDGKVRDTARNAYSNSVPALYAFKKNGKLELGEEPSELEQDSQWGGNCRLFLFKSSGITYGGGQPWAGYCRRGGVRWSVVFSGDIADVVTPFVAAHEMGHQLELSTRNDDGRNHDFGPVPSGSHALMHKSVWDYSRWIRRRDWKQANDTAADRISQ